MLFKKLSNLVESNNLTKPEYEAIVYGLTQQQTRLFLFLTSNGEANTIEVSTTCSIGNVSDCASALTKKLNNNGDSRQVICLIKPHINRYDQKGIIGYWRIVEGASNDINAGLCV